MAVLALNLMHDNVLTGRGGDRMRIASWMAVALSRNRAKTALMPPRITDTDVLGHGLPSPQPHFTHHEDTRPA